MPPTLLWRPLMPADLPALAAIAAQVHPAFPEDAEIFAERQRLYPSGMRLLERDGQAVGYIVSHPWRSATVPALNRLLHAIPADADTFYIHDLALLPVARGGGGARRVIEGMAEHARAAGFATMSLVAVNGSVPFWQRQGFAISLSDHLQKKLESYEAAARLMVRML